LYIAFSSIGHEEALPLFSGSRPEVVTPPLVASVVFVVGILGLFAFERDRKAQTSKALWLPVIWMLIIGSRSVSEWLGIAPEGSIDQNLEGNPLDRIIFSGLLALGLIVLVARRRKALTLMQMNGPLLLFFAYCAISVLWSDFPGVALKRWIKALGDPIMIMVILTDPDRSSALKRFFAWTAFVLMPVSILFIKYYPRLGKNFSPLDGSVGFIGVASDKNMLGAICLISGLGAVWRVRHAFHERQHERGNLPLIAQGVILAMVVWLLWNANSMTSIGCLAFGSVLLVATSFPGLARRRPLIHGLVATALAAACVPLFLDAAGGVLSAVGRDPTLTQRTELWGEVVKLTPNPLLGAGFESFWLGKRLEILWDHFWWRPNESHNGYIEVYLNLGWVGIVLLASLLIVGYRHALATLRREPQTGELKLACLVAGVMYSLTEAGFRMMHPMWICTMLAAVAWPETAALKNSVAEKIQAGDCSRRQPPKRWQGRPAFDVAATTAPVRPTRESVSRGTGHSGPRWHR
jgi:exopolysaccharide production protein ExoQ